MIDCFNCGAWDDDLIINKQGTIEALQAYCDMNCEYTKQQRDLCCGSCKMGDAIDIVDSLPSVQPKTARWTLDRVSYLPEYVCTNCKASFPSIASESYSKLNCANMNFCPNCGAKMEGGAE